MVHLHPIKFAFHTVLGEPIPILTISGNIFLWFIDSTGFNVVKSLNITIVEVPYFSVGVGMCYVTSYSLNYCNEIFFNFF